MRVVSHGVVTPRSASFHEPLSFHSRYQMQTPFWMHIKHNCQDSRCQEKKKVITNPSGLKKRERDYIMTEQFLQKCSMYGP